MKNSIKNSKAVCRCSEGGYACDRGYGVDKAPTKEREGGEGKREGAGITKREIGRPGTGHWQIHYYGTLLVCSDIQSYILVSCLVC